MKKSNSWDLVKVSNGHYVSRDERFSVLVALRKGKNDHWVLMDCSTGREEKFPTKKACHEALRSRYSYWK